MSRYCVVFVGAGGGVVGGFVIVNTHFKQTQNPKPKTKTKTKTQKVKKAYFENKRDRGVVRLVRAISGGEWGAVVGVSPLGGWRETLCVVLTYGGEAGRGLCGRLGDRLRDAGKRFDLI